MSRAHLTVILGSNFAEFSGPRTREMYQSLYRRPPIRNTRTARWSTTPKRARDLVALAESRGYDVTVTAGGDQ